MSPACLPPPHPCRVKRSLNGAVAAAAGPPLVRRSMDVAPPLQQLSGISRKRLEAELLSPPMPRKSSRTQLDEQHAAEMMSRLQLAGPQGGGTSNSGDPGGGAAAAQAALAAAWAAPHGLGPAAPHAAGWP